MFAYKARVNCRYNTLVCHLHVFQVLLAPPTYTQHSGSAFTRESDGVREAATGEHRQMRQCWVACSPSSPLSFVRVLQARDCLLSSAWACGINFTHTVVRSYLVWRGIYYVCAVLLRTYLSACLNDLLGGMAINDSMRRAYGSDTVVGPWKRSREEPTVRVLVYADTMK